MENSITWFSSSSRSNRSVLVAAGSPDMTITSRVHPSAITEPSFTLQLLMKCL
ncbi:hypothetical protein HanXRQr2_Chr12g0530951 [Helianthus annuus]|uniref:Uncharacterized protein n=1 Tax=Helianthus annuus TaxID=4232 RepID=A0A9K3ENW5_HELAN|nr:hypothetical protein HanXRQr2_Chr12g0530951 [Helianthus annuus]KAJ0861874.1 hypothetical protein HanPSC8_Chr12g0511601 [Helianthus annuus]